MKITQREVFELESGSLMSVFGALIMASHDVICRLTRLISERGVLILFWPFLKIDAVVTAEVFSSRRTFLFMMMQILKGKPPSQGFSDGEQWTPLSGGSLIHHPTQAES